MARHELWVELADRPGNLAALAGDLAACGANIVHLDVHPGPGDTVIDRDLLKVAKRLSVDVALLHLGGVRFGVTGPLRYTLTARDAVGLCKLLKPRVAIPIHYEGWSHFREGRAQAEREFAAAPGEVRNVVRWVPIGEAVEVA